MKRKNRISSTGSSISLLSKVSDLGPCRERGNTFGSLTSTSKPAPTAKPLTQSNTSESEIDSQNRSGARHKMMGSLMMPAFSSISGTYMHWPGTILDRSLGVRYSASLSASGPLIST